MLYDNMLDKTGLKVEVQKESFEIFFLVIIYIEKKHF